MHLIFASFPSFLTSYSPMVRAQVLTVFMIRRWYGGTLTWCPPSKKEKKKAGALVGLGPLLLWVMYLVFKQDGAPNGELTSTHPTPNLYIAVKTSYIDMSSRFTAPHCLSYYQAINSRAGMNWLTLRGAGAASCNLIRCIICQCCSFFPLLKHACCHINAAFIRFID